MGFLHTFLITCSIFLKFSLATLNPAYFFQENLPQRNLTIKPQIFTAIPFPAYYEPIILFQFQSTSNPTLSHEKSCHAFQRKIDLSTEFSLELEDSIKDFDYDSLLLIDKSLLFLLSERNILYKYSLSQHSIDFLRQYNFSTELQGAWNSHKRLMYMKETGILLIISNEKAIGFRNPRDLSDDFTIYENYKKISNIYEVLAIAHLVIIAAGSEGVFLYDVSENSMKLQRHLLYEENGYRISDARDLAFDAEFLYVLDKNAGVLFFSLPNFDFQGTNIAILNGDFLAQSDGQLFYISGEAGHRYFTAEILYSKENRTFFVNRRTDEILPVKHIEIFGDRVFVLSGETLKVFDHSIPAEWVNYRHNLVNFSTEKGLHSFFSAEPGQYKEFLAFTREKIARLKVSEVPPYIICNFKQKDNETHEFQLDIYSRNCPAKAGNSPIYSLCHGKERIRVEVKENSGDLLDLGYHSLVISVVMGLGIVLVVTCFVGWFFYWKHKRNIRRLNLEMEDMKKRVKYEKIREELESSKEKETNISKEIA